MRNASYLKLAAGCLLAAGMAWPAEESTTIHTCVTSGSGPTYMKVCISKHGNVVRFESPQGKEHLGVTGVLPNGFPNVVFEGYNACVPDPWGVLDYVYQPDLGHWFEDGTYWAQPHLIEQPNGANTFPLRIYRKNEYFELKQEFNRDVAERELTITMTLYNRSGQLLKDVLLERFADLDVSNDYLDDTFSSSSRSLLAWDAGNAGDAVALTNLTNGIGRVIPFDLDLYYLVGTDNLCIGGSWDPNEHYGPWGPYDYLGVVTYDLGDLPAGASRTVKLSYRVF